MKWRNDSPWLSWRHFDVSSLGLSGVVTTKEQGFILGGRHVDEWRRAAVFDSTSGPTWRVANST